MNIVADENIPLVRDCFDKIGNLKTLAGRSICRADLIETDLLLVRSVTKVDQELLDGTPVRFVASATAGFDHIDINYLEATGVAFSRAPGSNALSAAEYVIAAICYWSIQNSRPLNSLSLGIIGCGQVGSRVAGLAKKLGLNCVLNDPPLQDLGMQGFTSIDEALSCDIVTLHTPLELNGPYPTGDLLDPQKITNLNPGTLLINAARGEVLHEQALLHRLQDHNDLDVVIDVWRNEPNINKDLLRYTLIGTPHIAGYSYDGKIRGTQMIYEACCRFLNLEPDQEIFTEKNPQQQSLRAKHQASADIRDAVLNAYPISEDDARLKCLLSNKSSDNAIYFDNLRKNYPVRREYSSLLFESL